MGSILATLGQIWSVIVALPKLLMFYNQLQKMNQQLADERRKKAEDVRRQELSRKADELERAQESENEQSQEDALSNIVDDYKRRVRK